MDDVTCPWSMNALRRLGDHIRDETPAQDNHPAYAEVMAWYNELAARVQREISSLNWAPLLLDRPFEVTSRPKTVDTLRQKLLRERGTPLPRVQDIAGVRFEAEMTLDEQDAVVTAVCGFFGHDPAEAVRDLRVTPHSGYRAVHIWLRLPARVEVQVRTHLQGEWANGYEAVADVVGRSVRYEQIPDDDVDRNIVLGMQALSTDQIAPLERNRNELASVDLAIEDARRRGLEPDARIQTNLEELRDGIAAREQLLRETMVSVRIAFESLRSGKV